MEKNRKKTVKAIFDWLCKPSTKPDITSYKWARREFSILSIVLLWTVWFCRVQSLYQYVKLIYRALGQRFKFGYTENASGRPDVPPWIGEIYFICWTILFSVAHVLDASGWFIEGLAIYYLFESSLWILYYTVFRRFFELGYTIYHRLEYITMIILLIPTQALCFSHLYSRSFREMLAGLMGVADNTTPFPVTVLGYVFAAIVISMIISTFPVENIKECGRKAKMFVVGCGDVVKQRLYPAIRNSGFAVETKVYDLTSVAEQTAFCNYYETEGEIKSDIDNNIDKNSVVWVETPPHQHFSYMEHYLESKAKLIVVEKPITCDREELRKISALVSNPKHRKRLFFLSYYILEKALPLYYIYHCGLEKKDSHAALYEKYLDVENKALVENWKPLFGKLKSVDVHIFEGNDARQWVKHNQNGGQLLETFLHNVLIASLFCEVPDNWTEVSFVDADYTQKVHEISLTAKNKEVDISLSIKKNFTERMRTAEICFEHGTIKADFNKKTAEIYFELLGKSCKLSSKPKFEDNYSILVDLVVRVLSEECRSDEIDGLKNQIGTINWLIDLKENQKI